MKDIADYEIICETEIIGKEKKFKAKQKKTGKIVTLAIIEKKYCEGEDFLVFFRQQAIDAAKLTHSNIIQVYEVGKADEFFYIAQEYEDCITLKSLLESAKKQDKLFPENLCLFVLKEVFETVKYIVISGTNNLQINAENILINRYGSIKFSGVAGFDRYLKNGLKKSDIMHSLGFFTQEIFSFSNHLLADQIFLKDYLYNNIEELASDVKKMEEKFDLKADKRDLSLFANSLSEPFVQKKAINRNTSVKKIRVSTIFYLITFSVLAISSLYFYEKRNSKDIQLQYNDNLEYSSVGQNSRICETKTLEQNINMPKKNFITQERTNITAKPVLSKDLAALIYINVLPETAVVYFDNNLIGEGDRVVRNVKKGDHILKITCSEYEDEIRIIKISDQKKLRFVYRNGDITEELNANF